MYKNITSNKRIVVYMGRSEVGAGETGTALLQFETASKFCTGVVSNGGLNGLKMQAVRVRPV